MTPITFQTAPNLDSARRMRELRQQSKARMARAAARASLIKTASQKESRRKS